MTDGESVSDNMQLILRYDRSESMIRNYRVANPGGFYMRLEHQMGKAGPKRLVSALIDNSWRTASLLERLPYPEAWRSSDCMYVVEYDGRRHTLQGWEVRDRVAPVGDERITVR